MLRASPAKTRVGAGAGSLATEAGRRATRKRKDLDIDTLEPNIEGSNDGDIHVPLSSAYTVTWTPSDSSVTLQLLESLTGAVSGTVTDHRTVGCSFPGTSGTGTIPAELMAEFEGGLAVSLICAMNYNPVVENGFGLSSLAYATANGVCRSAVFE